MRGLALVQSKIRKCSERALWPPGAHCLFWVQGGQGECVGKRGWLAGLTCDINIGSHIWRPSLRQHSLEYNGQSMVNKSLGDFIRAGGRGQALPRAQLFPRNQIVGRFWVCGFLLYFENPQPLPGHKFQKCSWALHHHRVMLILLALNHPWDIFLGMILSAFRLCVARHPVNHIHILLKSFLWLVSCL